MIAIELIQQDNTHKCFAYNAILRNLKSQQVEFVIWNSGEKNIYDLCDELKPNKIISVTNHTLDRAKKLNIETWDFVGWYTKDTLIADPLAYKKLDIDPNLECENVCIAPFSDVDKYNDFFYKMMDHSNKYFRYFGCNRFGGHKDMGTLELGYHSMILSSAKFILALSPQFAVNAYLCNKNVVSYELTAEIVNESLVDNVVKQII